MSYSTLKQSAEAKYGVSNVRLSDREMMITLRRNNLGKGVSNDISGLEDENRQRLVGIAESFEFGSGFPDDRAIQQFLRVDAPKIKLIDNPAEVSDIVKDLSSSKVLGFYLEFHNKDTYDSTLLFILSFILWD